MPGPQGEWLEGENPFAAFDDRKNPQQTADERKAQALKFASLIYATFTSGSGKILLETWSKTLRQRRHSPSAGASELSYYNGVREFIEGIHTQMEFARTGGGTPQPDDIWFNT